MQKESLGRNPVSCVYMCIYIYIHCIYIYTYIHIIAYSKSTERMIILQNLLTSRQVEATNSAPSKGAATSSQGKGSCASCLRETCRELIFKGTGGVRTSFCGWLLQKSGKLTHQLRLVNIIPVFTMGLGYIPGGESSRISGCYDFR